MTEAITGLGKRKGVKAIWKLKMIKPHTATISSGEKLLKQSHREDLKPNALQLRPYIGGIIKTFHLLDQSVAVAGLPQFPKQRVCIQCQAKDEMDDYRFVGQSAKVTTYTVDYLAASPAPPMLVAVVDFDAGGRIIL